MERIGRRGAEVGLQAGTTVEELTQKKSEPFPLESSPLATSEMTRLINPPAPPPLAGIPPAENPFATPYGPQLDVVALSSALIRSKSETGMSLQEALGVPLEDISRDRIALMRGSLSLEQKMIDKLENVLTMLRDVRAKMSEHQGG